MIQKAYPRACRKRSGQHYLRSSSYPGGAHLSWWSDCGYLDGPWAADYAGRSVANRRRRIRGRCRDTGAEALDRTEPVRGEASRSERRNLTRRARRTNVTSSALPPEGGFVADMGMVVIEVTRPSCRPDPAEREAS